jgi:hypothetical protein
MKSIITIMALLVVISTYADDTYDNGLFDLEKPSIKLETEQKFIEFMKTNKPSTYTYFQRLGTAAQKRVFAAHQQDHDIDITEIVLQEYRNRS